MAPPRIAAAALLAISLSAPASALNLAWNPNPENDIARYLLRYGTSPGVHPNTVDAGLSTSAAVSGLQQGTTYYFVVAATDQAGAESAPSAEISYQVPGTPPAPSIPLIPSNGWTLKYASSQEIEDEDGRAINAFDGNTGTIWHSRFLTNSAPPPHELQIDLGTAQSIQGFRYLPRQDEYNHGNIGQYEFYVSIDGVNWGSPVATGIFANSKAAKEVFFPSKTGRYVRLVALTDLNGGTVASVAELSLLQGTGDDVPVNQAPVATAQSVTTSEDQVLAITLSASDADGDLLVYAVVSAPSKGTLSGSGPSLTYLPNADATGSDSFTFRANDGTANSNTATVSITVTPVNDAPVAVSKSASTAENTPVSIVLSASDKDSNSLTYTIVNGPSKGALSGTAPNLTYTPNAGVSGADSFTYRVSDGTANSNTATVSITVSPANDAPVAVSKSVVTAEDVPVSIVLTASDVDSNSMTFSVVNGPTKGVLSGAAPNLTYAPNADFSGADSFTFRANDGAANSNTATVTISVTPMNDPPVAMAQQISTAAGVPVSIVLSASDKDGNPLTYAIISGPANGTLSGTAPNVSYTPNGGFGGSDSFTFRASDGAANSNTAIVSITVSGTVPPPNIGPAFSANPIAVTCAEDSQITGQLDASDPDETGALVFAKLSGPSWLSVSPGGLLSGTPSNQNVGINSFIVRVTDSSSVSATASLTVTVSNTDDAPVFTINPITRAPGVEESPYDGGSIAASATDPDAGDAISFSKISGPEWLTVSPNGGLSGMPPVGSAGTNAFTVRATDKAGAFGEAALNITIGSPGLPLPWQVEDLGKTGRANRASCTSECFTLEGSGQFAGTSDSGCYLWQTASGDCLITARLISPADGVSKSLAGVMIRDSLAPTSQQIFMGMDGLGGLCWQRRSSTGGLTRTTTSSTGRPPDVWMRLVRKGRTVSVYKSLNGFTWTRVGSMTTRIGTNCYLGLSVASGGENTSAATFSSNVAVTP